MFYFKILSNSTSSLVGLILFLLLLVVLLYFFAFFLELDSFSRVNPWCFLEARILETSCTLVADRVANQALVSIGARVSN